MRNEILDKMLELSKSNVPFAHAQITRRKVPTSGKPGDHAIITDDGKIYGWIGGGCTRGIVLKESILSIKDGKPRYVVINKEQQTSSFSNTKVYRMTCQSGGEVEVYIEPVIPKPQLLLFGNSHIGRALCKIAKVMDYRVTVAMTTSDSSIYPEADSVSLVSEFSDFAYHKKSYIIVCSQGDGDMPSLLKALQTDSDYVGFVASRIKANSVFNELRQHNISFDQLKTIKTPVGIDIGGKSAEEVAISILAEIIKIHRSESDQKKETTPLSIPNDDYYLNPVCNIPIQKSTAKHVLQYGGESVYFCCDGCKVSFEKAPEKYVKA